MVAQVVVHGGLVAEEAAHGLDCDRSTGHLELACAPVYSVV